MKRWVLLQVALIGVALVALAGYGVYQLWWSVNYYVEEHTDYDPPPVGEELPLVDDKLADKSPAFDETLVDSRPLGDWELNASAAVVRLDCPIVKPDSQGGLLLLRPSYAKAVVAAQYEGQTLLASANLLDGAAKQFDDGLYAAVDVGCFRGELGPQPGPRPLIEGIFERLPEDSPARPFLAAALELTGKKSQLLSSEAARKRALLEVFESNESRSKPISFYAWTPELGRVWRFFQFLQEEFADQDLAVPAAMAAVLKDNPPLLQQYRDLNAFYGRLTNPRICLSVDALIDSDEPLAELAKKLGARRATVAVFPPSTSRESELFDAMFGETGLPPGVNLMGELIRRIRSGEVKFQPTADSGWYQYQAFALETMLLPGRGQEGEKLLLTAAYKRRLVEAFKALVTKRRETHARQLFAGDKKCDKPAPLRGGEVRPRLRVEPCATFYLRTARAYAFLEDFLTASVGKDKLAAMHGLRADGQREPSLGQELAAIRQRFYGFYLVACEDIGMRPELLEDEPVDREAAIAAALAWLENIESDSDLACDTRVSVPIFVDPIGNKTRLWCTLGVRLTPLAASYARPPKVRPKETGGPWQEVERHQLGESRYVIPVDEFAEIELDGLRAMTREELREVCNEHKTKEEIVKALAR